jgi:hypothetical protein
MRSFLCVVFVMMLVFPAFAGKKDAGQIWKTGKVVDENRARYLAGIHHSTNSSTRSNGSWNGAANSTDIGNTTNTNMNGSYSGSSTTSSSGLDMPLYRVYENLIVEGDDMVYVTSERLRWRWSKGAQVTVNGEVKYYVDGRKLHVLDDSGKEHTIQIVKQITKTPADSARISPSPDQSASQPGLASSPQFIQQTVAPARAATGVTTALEVSSTPSGADVEIDGSFVGNTPSSVGVAPGEHTVRISKTGYVAWERKITTSSGNVKLSPELVVSAGAAK